jgi:protein TonB
MCWRSTGCKVACCAGRWKVIVPVEMLTEFVEPPAPKVVPPPPAPPKPEVKQPVVKTKVPTLPPAPKPLAIADPTPAPNAPTGAVEPQPPAPPIAAPVAVAPPPAPPAPPAPPKVELPSSNADYLQNPKPVYPQMSKRLGEQGKVVYSVLIGVDGRPQSASWCSPAASIAWTRLPYTAVKCGVRAGQAQRRPDPMAYNAPINYVLE